MKKLLKTNLFVQFIAMLLAVLIIPFVFMTLATCLISIITPIKWMEITSSTPFAIVWFIVVFGVVGIMCFWFDELSKENKSKS